jgi:4-aminobutyrate aminotransferase
LLIGIEFVEADGAPRPGMGASVAEAALQEGLLLLPAGEVGEVLELSPPVMLTKEQTRYTVDAIERVVRRSI